LFKDLRCAMRPSRSTRLNREADGSSLGEYRVEPRQAALSRC
jgi:hypothetical protein